MLEYKVSNRDKFIFPMFLGYQPFAYNTADSELFECVPNLSLLSISQPKSQTTCANMKNIMIVWMIFGSKLLSSFSMSAIYSFLKYLRYRETQTSSGYFKNM